MVFDGKTYRNLQDQVAYLTSMYKALGERIEEVAAQIPSKMIVEELPEEGDPLITYYVGPKGTAPNQYYEVWVWVQEEPDGPFVWRELEDTDQVDLSGYLEKDTTASTYPKVYVKWGDGTQGLENLTQDNTFNAVVRRKADGRITVPAPSADGDCTNKKYVVDNFLAKQTGATTYLQAYVKMPDGTQEMVNVEFLDTAYGIVQRNQNGQIRVPNTPTDNNHAVSKKYVDETFLPKQTGTSSYAQAYTKKSDGTQEMRNLSGGATASSIPIRDSNGQLEVKETPTANNHAASKAYVDAAVGQLLYLHDLEIIVTIDSTNYLYVKAYLVNGSSTAITSFDRILYKRIDVQWGAYGPDIANCEPCAVAKLPDTFRQDEFDDPFAGFLYQYISAGNLISGKTDSSMSTTITDTVISF